jgi:hypothetical protein
MDSVNYARSNTKSIKFSKILQKFWNLRKKKSNKKKNIVLCHKIINKETKEQFQKLVDELRRAGHSDNRL